MQELLKYFLSVYKIIFCQNLRTNRLNNRNRVCLQSYQGSRSSKGDKIWFALMLRLLKNVSASFESSSIKIIFNFQWFRYWGLLSKESSRNVTTCEVMQPNEFERNDKLRTRTNYPDKQQCTIKAESPQQYFKLF